MELVDRLHLSIRSKSPKPMSSSSVRHWGVSSQRDVKLMIAFSPRMCLSRNVSAKGFVQCSHVAIEKGVS